MRKPVSELIIEKFITKEDEKLKFLSSKMDTTAFDVEGSPKRYMLSMPVWKFVTKIRNILNSGNIHVKPIDSIGDDDTLMVVAIKYKTSSSATIVDLFQETFPVEPEYATINRLETFMESIENVMKKNPKWLTSSAYTVEIAITTLIEPWTHKNYRYDQQDPYKPIILTKFEKKLNQALESDAINKIAAGLAILGTAIGFGYGIAKWIDDFDKECKGKEM